MAYKSSRLFERYQPWSAYVLALALVSLLGAGYVYYTNQAYKMSPAERQLLSRSSVTSSKVSYKKGLLSYNRDSESKVGGQKLTVASATDSSSKDAYRVTLASKASKGIEFSDSTNDLPFKLIPLSRTGSGKYINGRMVYPVEGGKGIYTLRRNGIKEDIILTKAPADKLSYSWKLELGTKLEAKLQPDGSVGIYSADPTLYNSNLQISDAKSQKLIDNARKNGAKNNLQYLIPRPYIKNLSGKLNATDVSFSLKDNILTLTATHLKGKTYPLSIDPTVVTTTTAQFRTGTDDGNIDYSVADEIDRGNISLGTVGTWNYTSASTNNGATFSAGFTHARAEFSTLAYNGYLYVLGGQSASAASDDCSTGTGPFACNGVQYAAINSDGTIGTWNYTSGSANNGATFSAGFIHARSYFGAVAYNGYMYVLGGATFTTGDDCPASTACSGVQYAPINSNGTIGTWNYTHSSTNDGSTFVAGFTQRRSYLSVVANNGYLYMLGGASDVSGGDCTLSAAGAFACNGVQYAAINANGTIGSWNYTHNSTNDGATFSAGYTQARYSQLSFVYNGYLYVLGGASAGSSNDCTTSSRCNGVQYAPINSNGTIGTWNYTGNNANNGTTFSAGFIQARQLFGGTVSNGYMYIIAGQSSSGNDCTTGSINFSCTGTEFAPINANGTVGAWHYTHGATDDSTTYVSGIAIPRTGIAVATYNGYLFTLGGLGTSATGDCTATTNYCNGVQFSAISTGAPSYGTIGAWHYTSANADNGTTFSAGFMQPRSDVESVAYNGYLYALGGYDGTNYHNDVQFAPINSNGTIGAWHYTSAGADNGTTFSAGFIQPRSNFKAAVYNGYLYVIGGISSTLANDCNNTGNYCNGVQFAPINSDGTVGAWHFTHNSTDDITTFSGGFVQPRDGLGAAAYNGYLYVAGGYGGSGVGNDCATTGNDCNGVQFAAINANGTIGSWNYTHGSLNDGATFSAGFMSPRSTFSLEAYNGYLYVMGGLAGSSANDCTSSNFQCNGVQFAAINSNGTIGTWNFTHSSTNDGATFVSGFTQPRTSPGLVAYNGYFYLSGGNSLSLGSDCADGSFSLYCTGVQYTPINTNGTVGAWNYVAGGSSCATWVAPCTTSFTQSRAGPGTAAYNGYLYILGGASGSAANDCASGQYCNGVQYTLLNAPSQSATYEDIVDIGGAGKITGLSFNGRAVCGMRINYRFGDSTGAFGSTQTIVYGLPGTTYSISGNNQRYVWVQFKLDDSNCGTRSQITDFTITYNVAPAAPTLSAPSAGATGVNELPNFQFKTTDADNDYLQYWIDVCSTSNCSSIVRSICQVNSGSNLPGTCTSSQTGWTGQDQQTGTAYTGNSVLASSTTASHTYQLGTLTKNTTFYWRAYAIDPGGSNTWSPASAIQSFTTQDDIPPAPTLVYPVSSSSGNSTYTTFQLRSTDLDSDYLEYWIDVCSTNTCSSIIRSICQYALGTGVPGTCTASQTGWASQDKQTGTAYTGNPTITLSTLATHNYQSPLLAANTTYWWRAYAIDPGGSNTWSSASAIQSFSTAPTETHIQGTVKFQGNVKL